MAINSATSDEWIATLVENLVSMQAFAAAYDVMFDTGTLRRSKITGLQNIGCVWTAGMTKPLQFRTGKQQGPKMRDDDPMGDEARQQADKELKAASRVRGRGTGRGGSGSGRGRGRGGGRGRGAHGGGIPAPDPDAHDPELGEPDVGAELVEVEREFDLADVDDASTITSVEELDHAFMDVYHAGPPQPLGDHPPPVAPDDREVKPRADEDLLEDETLQAIAEASKEIVKEAVADASGSSTDHLLSDPAPAAGPAEPPPPPPPPLEPWRDFEPMTAQGYFYLRGRQICRIQRRAPAKSERRGVAPTRIFFGGFTRWSQRLQVPLQPTTRF
eukprot:5463772-Pyramimonas_sp.AAC.1